MLLNNKTGKNDLQIFTQNYGVNEFDVPLLKTPLLLFPEIAKFCGFVSRIQLCFRHQILFIEY